MNFQKAKVLYSRREHWLAVYGSYVAQQVHQCMIDGRVEGFVEEAVTVADMADEAFERR